MFFIVGSRRRERDHSYGYFYCPTCRKRRAAAQGTFTRYFTFFFIPIFPIWIGGDYFRCEYCGDLFDADPELPFDFGSHREPKVWTCLKCFATNPSHRFRCEACGADS